MNTKGKIILTMHHLSSRACTWEGVMRYIGMPIRVAYKVLIQWILGVDLPDSVKIGANLTIYHGVGLVVHKDCVIGKDVTLRHCTTIGERHKGKCDVPTIGDNVDIGANTVLLGAITIGNDVLVGAGSVVLSDIPSKAIFAGNPARLVGWVTDQ